MLGGASRILEPLILLGFVASFDLLSVPKGSELFSLASLSVGTCPQKCGRHGGATLPVVPEPHRATKMEERKWSEAKPPPEDISLAGLT